MKPLNLREFAEQMLVKDVVNSDFAREILENEDYVQSVSDLIDYQDPVELIQLLSKRDEMLTAIEDIFINVPSIPAETPMDEAVRMLLRQIEELESKVEDLEDELTTIAAIEADSIFNSVKFDL